MRIVNDSLLVKNMPSVVNVAQETKAMWAADRIEGVQRKGTPQADTHGSVFASVTLLPTGTG